MNKSRLHAAPACPGRLLAALLALASLMPFLTRPALAADPAAYILSDNRVLYVADAPETIDWPTLYYLNDEYGCRVDIALLHERSSLRITTNSIPGRAMHLHRFYLPPGSTHALDSVMTALFSDRYPDIVLFESPTGAGSYNAFRADLLELAPAPERRFNILKIYERIVDPGAVTDSASTVFLNSRELAARHSDRIATEIPRLLGYAPADQANRPHLVRYRLVTSRVGGRLPEIVFLSGIKPNRLADIIEQLVADGPKRTTLLNQTRQFLSSLHSALTASGPERTADVLSAYRSLNDFLSATDSDPLLDAQVDLRAYLADLQVRTEELALAAAGLRWEGAIVMRDSPDGRRLKFRATLSADGPQEASLSAIRFHPYWDTVAVPLDTIPRIIAPHQTFVREYLVDVDPGYLETNRPNALVFTADIICGPIPLTMRTEVAVGEQADLGLSFEPDYYFLPPVGGLDIDHVVTSTVLRVVIHKPRDFAGTVKLNLETPRGLFAGAYQQELTLTKDAVRELVRIPFSISKLFELGLQHQIATLSWNGAVVATDTARIRIASCAVDSKTKIAFLPDTTGQLEDILNMTGAGFQPITDRGLLTANLNAYDVLVIGSGAFRTYPSFPTMKDRFEDYVRLGGSLVIFGQPTDWPDDVLPIRLVPEVELVDQNGITNRIPGANILSRPYPIIETNLLSSFYKKRDVATAVVAPAERVYVTTTGSTLLSVSRIGDGQIIYCGLPLLDMIARLDIDAIHLFANILNY